MPSHSFKKLLSIITTLVLSGFPLSNACSAEVEVFAHKSEQTPMRTKGEADVFDSPFPIRNAIKKIPAGNQITVTGTPYGADDMAMIADGNGVAYMNRADLIPPYTVKSARINAMDGQDVKAPCPEQPGQVVLTSEPKHGDLSRTANQLIYRPQPGYSGKDSFSCLYKLGAVVVTETTVTVSVSPPPPEPPPPPPPVAAPSVAATAPITAPPPPVIKPTVDQKAVKSCDAQTVPPPRDLSNCQLTGLTFRRCDFRAVNFAGANLEGTRFINCELGNANFSRARLAGASFGSSDLTGANLQDADVNNVNWAGSTVTKADLKNVANLNASDFAQAYGYRQAHRDLPEPDPVVKAVVQGAEGLWDFIRAPK